MIEAVEALLDDFGRLPARVERAPTFLEIAGYPHYENVCSNVLAFYLDPGQPHGLGTLLLDALARAGNIAPSNEGVGGNISVEREVVTEAGNRIDLLIESDAQATVVENKIRAAVNNPFADYSRYLDRRTPEARRGQVSGARTRPRPRRPSPKPPASPGDPRLAPPRGMSSGVRSPRHRTKIAPADNRTGPGGVPGTRPPARRAKGETRVWARSGREKSS